MGYILLMPCSQKNRILRLVFSAGYWGKGRFSHKNVEDGNFIAGKEAKFREAGCFCLPAGQSCGQCLPVQERKWCWSTRAHRFQKALLIVVSRVLSSKRTEMPGRESVPNWNACSKLDTGGCLGVQIETGSHDQAGYAAAGTGHFWCLRFCLLFL